MKCRGKNSIGLVVIYGEINVSLEVFGAGFSCVGSSERFNQLLTSDREHVLGLLPDNHFILESALLVSKIRQGLTEIDVGLLQVVRQLGSFRRSVGQLLLDRRQHRANLLESRVGQLLGALLLERVHHVGHGGLARHVGRGGVGVRVALCLLGGHRNN